MEKSSFFNSVSHDRTYKAEDWAEYFASFIGNGIFPVPSTGLQVVAGSGMNVTVRAGKAWINGYFYQNTGDLTVQLATADGQLKLCLHYENGLALKPLLRQGAEDDEIRERIAAAVKEKPRAHSFSDKKAQEHEEKRKMVQIGG